MRHTSKCWALPHLKEISSRSSGTCRIGDHAVPHVRDYNDSGPKPRAGRLGDYR